MKYYPSPAQKQTILDLNRKCELDVRVITLMHKPVLMEAGLWNDREIGVQLDVFLGELSYGQATKLIGALQNHGGSS
jgi:hypothetical protein